MQDSGTLLLQVSERLRHGFSFLLAYNIRTETGHKKEKALNAHFCVAHPHPPAQRFLPDLNLMMFGQLFSGKRRPEIVPVRLSQDRQRLLLRFRGKLAVGGLSPQPMHYHGIPLFLHPPQQFPHPALGHSHPLGSFPLRHLPVPGSFQPLQPVPFLLAHCDSFHPSALRLSIGTFYLAQLGTSHLAATWLNCEPPNGTNVRYHAPAAGKPVTAKCIRAACSPPSRAPTDRLRFMELV